MPPSAPKFYAWLSKAARRRRALNINPKLLHRWQQAQVVAEVGSETLAHDPELRALRAADQQRAQEPEF